jgi:hypothetical protein
VLHEPPYVVDDKRPGRRPTAKELAELAESGRRREAVEVFMIAMGLPPEVVTGMRHSLTWPSLEALAHTLAYDAALTGDDDALPVGRAATVTATMLTIDCDSSPEWLRNSTRAVSAAIPNASHTTLEEQDHFTMKPADLAPVLVRFLGQ